jgi:hypothetical protein
VLNIDDVTSLATVAMRLAAKAVVAFEARRNCPAGGSLAKEAQGVADAQAMCSGCEKATAAVWPGVSMSCGEGMSRACIYEQRSK